MTSAVPDILARIVEHKRAELSALPADTDRLELAAAQAVRRDFAAALARSAPAIIAEVKQASPSRGVFDHAFDPARIALDYERGGAAALSVLTDQRFFRGSLADLENARGSVHIPVLRKDFTIDRSQILQAAAHGADAILLIVAILSDRELLDYREYAESFKMAALVEVHDAGELARAAASGARIIGVNNRDLRTFEVRLETSLELAARVPAGAIPVSESGIHSREDVARLRAAGYGAFLVGEHLMRSGDPARAIEELRA
jgi:indole-3-glycerol phosphate synthase